MNCAALSCAARKQDFLYVVVISSRTPSRSGKCSMIASFLFPRMQVMAGETPIVHADGGCSVSNLHVAYAAHGQGTFLAPVPGFPAPPFPFGEAGVITFDGAGKLFGKTTINAGGLLLTPTFTGTYTVNSDCTGSLNIQSDLGPLQEAIVVIGGGQRYVGTETDPAAVRTFMERPSLPYTPGTSPLTALRL
jgi:hypothetical protein